MNPKSNSAGQTASAFPSSHPTPKVGSEALTIDQILPADILPMKLKEVAQLVKVSVKTVRRWIQFGLLRSHKLGGARVVRPRDLRTFLDALAGESNKEPV